MSKPLGRPPTYTDEIADEICEVITEGGSLRIYCANETKPSRMTIYKWKRERPEFSKMMEQAYRDRAETLFDDLLPEARDTEHTTARARLITDVMAKMAERYHPEKFQPSKRVENTGEMAVLAPTWIEKDDKQ